MRFSMKDGERRKQGVLRDKRHLLCYKSHTARIIEYNQYMNSWSYPQSNREILKLGVLSWLRGTSKPTSRLQATNYYDTMYSVLMALQQRPIPEQMEGLQLLMDRVPSALQYTANARYPYKRLMELNRFALPGQYCSLLDRIQQSCPVTKSPSYTSNDYIPVSLYKRYAMEIQAHRFNPQPIDWAQADVPEIFQQLGQALLQNDPRAATAFKHTFVTLPLDQQLDVLTFYSNYRSDEASQTLYKKCILEHLHYYDGVVFPLNTNAQSSVTTSTRPEQKTYQLWAHYCDVRHLLKDYEEISWKSSFMHALTLLPLEGKTQVLYLLHRKHYEPQYNETYQRIFKEIPDAIKKEMCLGALLKSVQSNISSSAELQKSMSPTLAQLDATQRLELLNHAAFKYSLFAHDFHQFIQYFDPTYASLFYDDNCSSLESISAYTAYVSEQAKVPTQAIECTDQFFIDPE